MEGLFVKTQAGREEKEGMFELLSFPGAWENNGVSTS